MVMYYSLIIYNNLHIYVWRPALRQIIKTQTCFIKRLFYTQIDTGNRVVVTRAKGVGMIVKWARGINHIGTNGN